MKKLILTAMALCSTLAFADNEQQDEAFLYEKSFVSVGFVNSQHPIPSIEVSKTMVQGKHGANAGAYIDFDNEYVNTGAFIAYVRPLKKNEKHLDTVSFGGAFGMAAIYVTDSDAIGYVGPMVESARYYIKKNRKLAVNAKMAMLHSGEGNNMPIDLKVTYGWGF